MRLVHAVTILIALIALAQCKQTAEELLQKGNLLFKQDQYDEAIVAYNEAIGMNPNYAIVWNNKAMALEMQGKYNESIEAYDEAIRLSPDDIGTQANKNYAIKKRSRMNITIGAYIRNMSEHNKVIEDGLTLLGNGLNVETVKFFGQLVEDCKQSLEKDPNNASTWNNKGCALIYLAHADRQMYLGDPGIEKNEAHAAKRASWEHEALNCIDNAIQLDPNCANAWHNRGYALYCLNDGYETIEYYEEIIRCFDKERDLANSEEEDRPAIRLTLGEYLEEDIRYKILELKHAKAINNAD